GNCRYSLWPERQLISASRHGEYRATMPRQTLMAGLIDVEAEVARLNKEIDKLSNEVSRVEKKLSNPNFVDKAPAEVVAKEKTKMEEAKSALAKLAEQRDKIAKL
ncbi:MAG: hypothetical protein MI976_01380, partial [Pseudomonadales bacterium]|nr:hypothetical protein [Pseudomonadales bacterium]